MVPTPAQITQIAAKSYSDPRTVQAYFAGKPMRSTRFEAIEAAIRDIGLDHLLRERASA